jgi:dipeptidyl aminopeptidase/acylaminoacyl peptidase
MRTPVILILAGVLLVAAAVGGWVAADRLTGDDGGAVVTATPTRTGTGTPSTSATPTAAGPALLYREFESGADTLWLAPAASPTDRKSVGRIDHASNWGISASLSPDGSIVAYLVLTSESQDPNRGAEAWVLDVGSGKRRHLADGFDLYTKPVWSPESDAFVLVRNGPQGDTGSEISLVGVDIADGNEDILQTEPDVLGLFPIGYSSAPAVGGALVYARYSLSGTDIGWLGVETPSVHVTNESPRDWHVSPDGARVAFLARQRTDGRIAARAFVIELSAASQAAAVLASVPDVVDHFNPVWRDDATLTVGRTPAEGESAAAASLVSLETETVEEVEPGPEQGFDVPMAWSPDGRYLVVRSFEGSSATEPGREQLTIIEEGAERKAVGEQGNLEFIGWLSRDSR